MCHASAPFCICLLFDASGAFSTPVLFDHNGPSFSYLLVPPAIHGAVLEDICVLFVVLFPSGHMLFEIFLVPISHVSEQGTCQPIHTLEL